MSRQICLMGRCDNTRNLAPLGSDEWEVWGLGRDELLRFDMLFEPHEFWNDPEYRDIHAKGFGLNYEGYVHWLNAHHKTVPIVVSEHAPELKNQIVFPKEEVKKIIGVANAIDSNRRNPRKSGEPYLESTFAYMLAYALYQHKVEGKTVKKIGLWGIDLDSASEWAYQRPNGEYLLGIARGMGIDIHIPKESHLLRSFWACGRYGVFPNGHETDMRPNQPKRDAA